MKFIKILLIIAFAGAVFYLIGPRPSFKAIDYSTPDVSISLDSLDTYISEKEAQIPDIKPGNKSMIIWDNDSLKNKTKYVLLYLHGFSASPMEGNPIHKEFAEHFGMNLYLPRLEDHGRSSENSFENLTPDDYFESAQQALEVAKLLGDSIVIMSCSTGGTLSILLEDTCPEIAGFIFYSPNIDLFDPTSDLIVQPWGKQILRTIMKGDYNNVTYEEEPAKYWNTRYHINGIVALKTLLHDYMTKENFRKFDKPFLLMYYYKDDEHQDDVVSVEDMIEFYKYAGTPVSQKKRIALTQAGTHVISSDFFSGELDHLREETYKFATEIIGLQPKP
ncbi:MAG: alpha/beta hydrolase [Saprospiraceae bacterium]|nr:alpha/beta hydrolase [Saprospiraceae bacterium]